MCPGMLCKDYLHTQKQAFYRRLSVVLFSIPLSISIVSGYPGGRCCEGVCFLPRKFCRSMEDIVKQFFKECEHTVGGLQQQADFAGCVKL